MAIVIEDIISDFKFSLIPYFIKKSYNKLLIIFHFADKLTQYGRYLFFFWLMGLSPIAPPHINARCISLVVFCKLHMDILIKNEFVVGYRDQFKDLIAPL